ncbi:MAG: HlyD family efflux transporter periplasmic adaptor subunit, partial [Candidatus Electrothrix sp. EH2]|nr:HlyD family efflux transporter periplasmic adaptor subunit [Candidatus Electrothrix sp. EH2]
MSSELKSPEKEGDLEEKYHQLRANYYQLEDEHFAVQDRLKRVRRRYRLFFFFLIIIGIGIGGYFRHGALTSLLPDGFKSAKKGVASQEGFVTVKRQTLRNTLSLTGKIEPLGQRDVVAPLAGMVLEKRFQYGDFVQKGTVLLTIDAGNEEVKYRQAQAEYLKAEAEWQSLQDWEQSLDVINKRHEIKKKQNELKTIRREVKKTRRLLKKGIVPSSELEQLEERHQELLTDIAFAKKQLAVILKKGSQEKVHLAKLKKENALLQMQALAARIEQARLVSPISGVIVHPVAGKETKTVELQTGSFVKQDQVLFTIANLQGFTVQARVDENDILKLRLGQEVTITGDAFQDELALKGTVQYISFQADKQESGRASSFSVRISVAAPTETFFLLICRG